MGASNSRDALPAKDCTLSFDEENEFASFIKKAECNPEAFLETLHTHFQTQNIWTKTSTGRPYFQIVCSNVTDKSLCNKFVAEIISQYGLKSMVKYGFEDEFNLLYLMIVRDDVVTLELLISKGIISNKTLVNFDIVHYMLSNKAVKCFKFMTMKNPLNIPALKDHQSILTNIMSYQAIDCFRDAVDNGLMEPNFDNSTCILRKAFEYKFFHVEFLDICHQKKVSFGIKDINGGNILHSLASYSADLDVPYEYAQAMIKYRIADLNERNFPGEVPILIAIKCGSPFVLQALLDNKADTTILDYRGCCMFERALHNEYKPGISTESRARVVSIVNDHLRRHGVVRRFTLKHLKKNGRSVVEILENNHSISGYWREQSEAKLALCSHFLTSVDYHFLRRMIGPKALQKSMTNLRKELSFWITVNLGKRFEVASKLSWSCIISIIGFLMSTDPAVAKSST